MHRTDVLLKSDEARARRTEVRKREVTKWLTKGRKTHTPLGEDRHEAETFPQRDRRAEETVGEQQPQEVGVRVVPLGRELV